MTTTPDAATARRTEPSTVTELGPAPADGGLVLRGVHKVLGGRTIVDALDLTVAKGELVCLLGPSGCGKTTTLRMVAGFLDPDAGSVTIDGQDVTSLPPERRPTAMVFQNYALWPHMSVFDNVAFPLKLRKTPKPELRQRVEAVLELVGLTHHLKSRPARISGGEQQRVALARALVQEPQVLLLDEPLSNLDAKLRVRVREDIREIQQRLGITTVIVTHDQDEALSVSDRVAVMNGGRIEQYAAPSELYRSPVTTFVGGFVGATNTVSGRLEPAGGGWVLDVGGSRVPVATTNLAAVGRDDDTVSVRPEDVVVGGDGVPAAVERVIPRGHFTEVVLRLGSGAEAVRAYVDADAALAVGVGSSVPVRFRRALAYRDGVLA
ncbi:ABC transporter ATP-binding protein [Lapillicoccus jejuensis]|uniref:Putative spermidine/putrescine transport system ATP-binding protein n=1 Tax=Lapillicoccus jejuensis TaxID=402171 RepID=A0A542E1W5_9MICO|nr:ABC transporter ATP-binding protein [Lapillicoccus jejuensis]TQJ09214.1 putative spermidine/putrescine transport system ATP-binding protein [Lapillicoccus jejuensis]